MNLPLIYQKAVSYIPSLYKFLHQPPIVFNFLRTLQLMHFQRKLSSDVSTQSHLFLILHLLCVYQWFRSLFNFQCNLFLFQFLYCFSLRNRDLPDISFVVLVEDHDIIYSSIEAKEIKRRVGYHSVGLLRHPASQLFQ